jgi:leader peptidase (prepilin peptidase)/N-methyltransferase
MISPILDGNTWAAVPFHFWSAVLFTFGCMVGSFLNVCIHRMPLGLSVVSPPSHCPHCKYSIPGYLNIPLVTWLYLRGKCAHCGAPISIRYFLVELLTGLVFLGCWLGFGHQSALLALVYCLLLAGLIVATFIDFEHFIIPDEITIGGMVAGFVCSFLVPALHGTTSISGAMKQSLVGMVAGAGLIYAILRGGKLLFGRQRVMLPPETRIVFTDTAVLLPDKSIPYEDIFYRESDTILIKARTLELVDRCYRNVVVRLSPKELRIGDEVLDPAQVPCLEAVSSEIVLPREAMGLGDVKFMGAIGAFLGWQAVLFTLVVSTLIGSAIGLTLVALRRRELSSRLPYGPYLAVAAAVWVFAGPELVVWYQRVLLGIMQGGAR